MPRRRRGRCSPRLQGPARRSSPSAASRSLRFAFGLGAVAGLNDGYPWGIWIAFDVVTGTALGLRRLRGGDPRLHPQQGRVPPPGPPGPADQPLGYTLAGVGVVDRPRAHWDLWRVPLYFWRWNCNRRCSRWRSASWLTWSCCGSSCRPRSSRSGRTRSPPGCGAFATRACRRWTGRSSGCIALGLLLPTMHQSSLGTLMLLPASGIHPLWFTPLLPLLFLVLVRRHGLRERWCSSRALSAAGVPAPAGARDARAPDAVAMSVSVAWLVLRVGDLARPRRGGRRSSAGYGVAVPRSRSASCCAGILILGSPARAAVGGLPVPRGDADGARGGAVSASTRT